MKSDAKLGASKIKQRGFHLEIKPTSKNGQELFPDANTSPAFKKIKRVRSRSFNFTTNPLAAELAASTNPIINANNADAGLNNDANEMAANSR